MTTAQFFKDELQDAKQALQEMKTLPACNGDEYSCSCPEEQVLNERARWIDPAIRDAALDKGRDVHAFRNGALDRLEYGSAFVNDDPDYQSGHDWMGNQMAIAVVPI